MHRRGFLAGVGSALAVIASGIRVAVARQSQPLATINASHQTGYTLIINPADVDLHVGDVIEIDGVYAMTRLDIPGMPHARVHSRSPKLRHFVVTMAAPKGSTALNIYPQLTPSYLDDGKSTQFYATTDCCPANRAAIRMVEPHGDGLSMLGSGRKIKHDLRRTA